MKQDGTLSPWSGLITESEQSDEEPTAPPSGTPSSRALDSIVLTAQGIRLYFNKPMNPIGASDANNYKLGRLDYYTRFTNNNFLFGLFGHHDTTVKNKYTQIESAQYDPASQSVLLLPLGWQNTFAYFSHDPYFLESPVRPGKVTQVHPARTSFRPRHPLNVAPGITDLEGNPINLHTTPGKVDLRIKYPTYPLIY